MLVTVIIILCIIHASSFRTFPNRCTYSSSISTSLQHSSLLESSPSELDKIIDTSKRSVNEYVTDHVKFILDKNKIENISVYKGNLLEIVRVLNVGLVEREIEIKLLLLAILSKEHFLLIGVPGTAKSELGRRVTTLIDSSSKTVYFERLLTKFTQPEEIFGPLSLKALENDEYKRNIDGYLPTATIAFLDEIFKSSSAILNSLLTILNERKYSNGNMMLTVPLLTMIAASNELPDSEELDALYDRFLIRKKVSAVSDESINDLLLLLPTQHGSSTSNGSTDTGITIDVGLIDIIQENISDVVLSTEVLDLIKKLRIYLRDECNTIISDRRLMKSVNLLKIAAITNGRLYVSMTDTLLLQHVYWTNPDDIHQIQEFILSNFISDNRSLKFLIQNVNKMIVKDGYDDANKASYRKDLLSFISILSNKIATRRLLEKELLDQVGNVWIGSKESIVCRQQLLPKLSTNLKELNRMLQSVISFQLIIDDEVNKHDMDYFNERVQLLYDYYYTINSAGDNNNDSDDSDIAGIDDDEASADGQIDLSANQLTREESLYSGKEAKKKLSPELYKLWKKQNKIKLKKTSNVVNQANDEFDD